MITHEQRAKNDPQPPHPMVVASARVVARAVVAGRASQGTHRKHALSRRPTRTRSPTVSRSCRGRTCGPEQHLVVVLPFFLVAALPSRFSRVVPR